jgi:integrase
MKKVADEEAHKLRILLDTGSLPPEHLRRKKGVATFDKLAKKLQLEWLDKLKTQELSRVSVDGYQVHLKMLGKTFAGRLLGSITREDVLSYRVEVAEETSNVTSNRRLFVLKQIFAKAKKEGLLNRDDICDLRYLSEKQHERTNWLNPEQLIELLEAASAARSRHYMPLAILLSAEHGASKQEILNLRWEDIDFDLGDCGCITFFREKNGVSRAHRLDMTRTRNALIARREYLAKCRKVCVEDVGGYVVGRPDGSRIKDIKSAWNGIRKAAGFDDLHFHDLRHTFCSNLVQSGTTLKQVKELIGHKTAKMTERYSHFEQMTEFRGLQNLAARYAGGTKARNKLEN